jgi:sugar lactone lactonase YvrE
VAEARIALDVRTDHAEGIVWDADRARLLFVDIPAGRVFEHDPAAATTAVHALGRDVGDVQAAASGALVVAVREGVALFRDGVAEVVAAPLADLPDIRMNDGNVDPAGRLFVGTMAYDQREGAAVLYRLDPDGTLSTVLRDVTISNGIDWSPDGSLLYYVDTPTQRIDVFDYDVASGTLSARRPFAAVPKEDGSPDGLTVDAEGCVWVALYDGGAVRRYDVDGRLDAVVETPGARLVTSCCFGGADLTDLWITTSTENLDATKLEAQPGAGRIYRVENAGRGKRATPFDDSLL